MKKNVEIILPVSFDSSAEYPMYFSVDSPMAFSVDSSMVSSVNSTISPMDSSVDLSMDFSICSAWIFLCPFLMRKDNKKVVENL